MAKRRQRKVFFAWERPAGFFGLLSRTRVRLLVAVLVVMVGGAVVHAREKHASGVRATRAVISQTFRAVHAYRADHDGACPRDLKDLTAGGYMRDIPLDAWGKPLRLVCPGRVHSESFDLSSDGPDGLAGGLDRVE